MSKNGVHSVVRCRASQKSATSNRCEKTCHGRWLLDMNMSPLSQCLTSGRLHAAFTDAIDGEGAGFAIDRRLLQANVGVGAYVRKSRTILAYCISDAGAHQFYGLDASPVNLQGVLSSRLLRSMPLTISNGAIGGLTSG